MTASLYTRYLRSCRYWSVRNQNGSRNLDAQKWALATNVVREELCDRIDSDYTVSAVGASIMGTCFSYNLLIVKKEAALLPGNCYRPEDVAAVVVCKANGLMNVAEDSSRIADAANAAYSLNPDIRFGYITLSETAPARNRSAGGVNLWELTRAYLSRKVKMNKVIYAVTLRQGKDIVDGGSDEEFVEFAEALTAA